MTALITVTFVAAILYVSAAFIRHAMTSICQRHKAMIKPQVEKAIAVVEEIQTEVIAVAVDAEKYAAMTVKELRQVCTQAGVQWRNVHGKNKHLKKREMITELI